MDYEVISQMQVDEWKEKIQNSLGIVINNILKKSFPFIVGIAELDFTETSIIMQKLKLKVILFVDQYPTYKEHAKLNKDFETLLNMMGLSKLDTSLGKWVLDLDVQLVLNN